MPTCVSVNSSTDFTTSALSAPDDGFSFEIVQTTPSPNATAGATPSPTPSPSATPIPTNTPSPTATTIPPTPTPTPTATGGGTPALPAAGVDCNNARSFPGYGISNKYTITLADNATKYWYKATSMSTRTFYLDSNTGGATDCLLESDDSDVAGGVDPPCGALNSYRKTVAQWQTGITFPSNQTGNFGIQGFNGTYPQTWTIWIV
jgi:hypothetical protein